MAKVEKVGDFVVLIFFFGGDWVDGLIDLISVNGGGGNEGSGVRVETEVSLSSLLYSEWMTEMGRLNPSFKNGN